MNELIVEEKSEEIFSHSYKIWAQCVLKQIFNHVNFYKFNALLLKLFRQVMQS